MCICAAKRGYLNESYQKSAGMRHERKITRLENMKWTTEFVAMKHQSDDAREMNEVGSLKRV